LSIIAKTFSGSQWHKGSLGQRKASRELYLESFLDGESLYCDQLVEGFVVEPTAVVDTQPIVVITIMPDGYTILRWIRHVSAIMEKKGVNKTDLTVCRT